MIKQTYEHCHVEFMPDRLTIPFWFQQFVDGYERQQAAVLDGLRVSVTQARSCTLVSAEVENAASLEPVLFKQSVHRAYMTIADRLRQVPHRHPVRFWNFIPHICASADDGTDRYMVFNAGRFTAFESWLGCNPKTDGQLPTATGVGHNGCDLVIHCLATESPGTPIDNPRQRPAFRYSKRYGLLPPCFARATVVPNGLCDSPLILVGGTASVRGEDSVHVGDIHHQIDETIVNLASLVRSACGQRGGCIASDLGREAQWWLDRIFHLRVYYVYPDHCDIILTKIKEVFPAVARIELMQAKLCRPELLVEVEGIAFGTMARPQCLGGVVR